MAKNSRWVPTKTLPALSAIGAWNRTTSGLSAGNSTIGSLLPNGLSKTFQSGRCASTSEPISPRSGMNGTPFSAAWNCACSAGQVASIMRIAPARIAAVKRGAGPNSPRLTAEVSSVSTQPAPIRRSACKVEVGSATRCKPFNAASDQRSRRRHGRARSLARHREHAAVGDRRDGLVEAAGDHRHVMTMPISRCPAIAERGGCERRWRRTRHWRSPRRPDGSTPRRRPTARSRGG